MDIKEIKEIKELIELINSSDIAYLELKSSAGMIKMDKSLTRNLGGEVLKKEKPQYIESVEEIKKSTEVVEKVVETRSEAKEEVKEGTLVTSPMVGTFYSSPSPSSPKFAEVGKVINKGDVLCIIEAMKLMNEIESEVNGEIVEILVKDGDMVEYGIPIFRVRENG